MVYLLPDVWLFVTLSDHGVFLPRCWFLNMLVLIVDFREGDTLMTYQMTPLISQLVTCSLLTSRFWIASDRLELQLSRY